MEKRNANPLQKAICHGSALLIFLIIRPPKLIPNDPTIRSKNDRFRFEIVGFILSKMDKLLKMQLLQRKLFVFLKINSDYEQRKILLTEYFFVPQWFLGLQLIWLKKKGDNE